MLVLSLFRNSFTVFTAISAALSFGKWNTPVDMQQNAMLYCKYEDADAGG